MKAAEDAVSKRKREIIEDGRQSKSTQQVLDLVEVAQATLAERSTDLEDTRRLFARGLQGIDVGPSENKHADAIAEFQRLTDVLAQERQQDQAAHEPSQETNKRFEELQGHVRSLMEDMKILKQTRFPYIAPTASWGRSNSNKDMTDISPKSWPSMDTGAPPVATHDVCFRKALASIPEFSSTSNFVDPLLTEATRITEIKIRNGLLEEHPELTEGKAKAVVVYTLELQLIDWRARAEDEFYRVYGEVIRKRNTQSLRELKDWNHYFIGGMRALPVYQGVLWRGVNGRKAVLMAVQNYNKEMKEIVWTSMASAAPNRDAAKEFASKQAVEGKSEDDTRPDIFPGVNGLCFRLEVEDCARDLRSCSAFGDQEDERGILPNSHFLVVKTAHLSDDGLVEIHMKEKAGSFKY